jgi:hypothetical protein
MTLIAAFLMPLVMLGMVFGLAAIEERHLKARPRVVEQAGAADPQDGTAPAV